MQNLLISYPGELIEEGLKYVNREIGTGNRRLDIAFLDRRNRLLLIEVQKDSLDTKHIDRHIDFVEGFAEKNPDVDIRLMYIANRIDPLRKSFLERRGYEYMEISINKFEEIARKYNIEVHLSSPEETSITTPIPPANYNKNTTDMRSKFISQFFKQDQKKFWEQFFTEIDRRSFVKDEFGVNDFGLRINNKHLKSGTIDYSLMFVRNGIFIINNRPYMGQTWNGLNRLRNWCETSGLPENFYLSLNIRKLIYSNGNNEIIDIPSLLKFKSPEQINNDLFQCIDLFQ